MRSYGLANADLDRLVQELIAANSDRPNQDLIAEIVTTALKLHRGGAGRGDLKLINTALKEIRYSLLVFSRHDEPKVTIFGSARLPEDDPNYRMAARFAELMAARGWGVITGGGPGIMEAGNRGAGLDHGYAVKIRLPFEAGANPYVAPDRTVNFKYFFTRKLGFVKESHAFALFPGGFGTLDETFELITLLQTGKSDLHPIVLLEAEGTGYWDPLVKFMEEVLLDHGMINAEDTNLFTQVSDVESAVEILCRFYANYHSQRYVDGRLVLRLRQAPDHGTLAQLNEDFSDIVVDGLIEAIPSTEIEVRDGDALDYQRIAFNFDRRHYGRLRGLIDRLNTLVGTPSDIHPPAPFGQEQADRTW